MHDNRYNNTLQAGGPLRMCISTLAVSGTDFAIYPQYSQHLVASTPAVFYPIEDRRSRLLTIGGNCRSPWHLLGDSDVNGLEYSQIQFQKLSSFEV